MQISLKYHGQNFENFNQILDPKNNVEYAAKFLRSLYSRNIKHGMKQFLDIIPQYQNEK